MKLSDLTTVQLKGMLIAVQDLIDGDFHCEQAVQVQTGLPLDRCTEIVGELAVLRMLEL